MGTTPKRARALSWVALLPCLVLGVGWIFHTSFDPTVLGKYSTPYFVFLVCWWLLVTPALYFFFRFLFDTQHIELTSGRRLHVRPSLKILLTILLGTGMFFTLRYRVHKAMGFGVTTAQRSDIFHPYLQNAPMKRRRFSINRWCFRGGPIEKRKPEGTIRIFALGGSTTFASPMPLEDTYPELLRVKLAAAYADRTIEMQNAGGDWHCSQHSLIKFLTSVQDFDPDLLLVFHGINDLARSLTPDLFGVGAFREDYRHFLGPASALVKRNTWDFLMMRFGHWFSDLLRHRVRIVGPYGDGVGGLETAFFPKAEPVEVTDWPSLAVYERNMRDLVLAARAKGIAVVLGTQPYLYRDDLSASERERLWTPISHQFNGQRADLASMRRGMEAINARTRVIARETGVPLADLAAAVPQTLEYLYDDVHQTKKGTERVAQTFFECIRDTSPVDALR